MSQVTTHGITVGSVCIGKRYIRVVGYLHICGCADRLQGRFNKFAGLVFNVGVRHFILDCVNKLDITDSAGSLRDIACYAGVALLPDLPCGPVYLFAGAYLFFPFIAYL